MSESRPPPVRRAADLPDRYNAVEILERNLAGRGDRVALLTDARELTFRQVADEVDRVGKALRRLGVRQGDTVAILSLDTAEWPICFFACLKIGAVAVGMSTLLTAREQAFM
ncbi:MAG: AMP-binding protein, partial [Longimicrobiales bacterium]